jgi:hypothetical protein
MKKVPFAGRTIHSLRLGAIAEHRGASVDNLTVSKRYHFVSY